MSTTVTPSPPPTPAERLDAPTFLPLLATLGGGVAAVTLVLWATLTISPTVGVVLGGVVMVLFVGFVLGGMQRLLSDDGSDDV